jgi:hypothetical protein
MHSAPLLLLLIQADDQVFRTPSYFAPVFLVLLVGGAVGWLVAAVLGFARARAFGASARWFALAAVCLIIYHLQLLVLGFGVAQRDNDLVLSIGAFFNLFIVLGSICAIVGFVRLTDPRP